MQSFSSDSIKRTLVQQDNGKQRQYKRFSIQNVLCSLENDFIDFNQ